MLQLLPDSISEKKCQLVPNILMISVTISISWTYQENNLKYIVQVSRIVGKTWRC